MILLAGVRYDGCLKGVASELQSLGEPFAWFDQESLSDIELHWEWTNGCLSGRLTTPDTAIELERVRAVYARFESVDKLLRETEPDDTTVDSWHQTMEKFERWMELTSARVLGRYPTQTSNDSKPFQLQIIQAAGFKIPRTVITNDEVIARRFCSAHDEVIFKGICGDKSVVKKVDEQDVANFGRLATCPVQFQERLDGLDIRVSVFGEHCLAVAIDSQAVDYRYWWKEGQPPAVMRPFELPATIRQKCKTVVDALGLEFAGVDLRLTSSGEYYCFEVNPMPGYSYFQDRSNVDISSALAGFLLS